SPGTDMTFFDWPHIGPNIEGTDSIAGTAFRVASRQALDFWAKRLDTLDVTRGEIGTFSGREILPFEDPEGQQLYLVNDNGFEFEGEIWPHAEIPDEFALRGFYSVVFSVPAIGPLDMVLTKLMNFEEVTHSTWINQDTEAVIYTTKSGGGPGSEVWVLVQPELSRARLGAGGTHHVAFRVTDFEEQKRWHAHLAQAGLSVSGLIDRFWFRSIYFRVSAGILFEIATDGPGFAVDEAPEALGESLVLPPFLEHRREEIEAGLTPIGAVSQ
ncbi:MAG: ring-cleaving dioxygenase, partial [Anaerolineales bacterium]